jgi:hypothetical protein
LKKKPVLPKNKEEVKKLKKIIIPYSQMKIRENNPPLYSTLNPETNSLSPSEKSKGVRLLSARQTNIQARRRKGKKKPNQDPTWKKKTEEKS